MKKTLLLFLAAAAMTLAGANASAQVSLGAGPATRIHFRQAVDVTYSVGVQVNFEDSQRVSDNFGYSAGVDFGTYKMKDFRPGIAMTEMYLGSSVTPAEMLAVMRVAIDLLRRVWMSTTPLAPFEP